MRNHFQNHVIVVLAGLFSLSAPVDLQLQAAAPIKNTERFLIVVGAPGQEQYEQQFTNWVENWKQIAAHKRAELTVIGESVDARFSDLEILNRELQRDTQKTTATWLVFIGHGTFDGKTARFNLRGPDLTAKRLSRLCDSIQHPLAVINCFSTSGAFLKPLSGDNRVIITATKNGHEFYFSHFGGFLSRAGTQQSADLDHDNQISLLEAYLSACRETTTYYQKKGELATEHALLDDNADQTGTRSDQFQGLVQTPRFNAAGLADGPRAHQFTLFSSESITLLSGEQKQLRDALEIQIFELKQQKRTFSSQDEYYQKLEPLMIQLAQIYHNRQQPQKRVIRDPKVIPVNAKKTGR